MRNKLNKGRILLILIMAALFGWAALYLYNKQKNKYDFLSFSLPNAELSLFIPDMHRLQQKVNAIEVLNLAGLPIELNEGISLVLAQENFKLDPLFGKSCFLSANADNYCVVFRSIDLTSDFIADYATNTLNIESKSSEENLTIGSHDLIFQQFGDFTCISKSKFSPDPKLKMQSISNADYTVFKSGDLGGTHHILSRNLHYTIKKEEDVVVKGKPVSHFTFFERIPSDFDEISFYGSSRLLEDANALFGKADSLNDNLYNWMDQGMIYLRKGDYELLIAPQNMERDLKLILEEESLAKYSDTAQIKYFNISSFEIMPFESTIKWQESIAELNTELTNYTEYLNYNVMANSIPALRWYIAQIQLGNMFFSNEEMAENYYRSVPQKTNYIHFTTDSSSHHAIWETKTWSDVSNCMVTEVEIDQNQMNENGLDVISDFIVEIQPTTITIVKDTVQLLLNNKRQLVMYESGIKKWRLDLSTDLVISPQIVDINNDGIVEVVLFQANQMDLIDHTGHSLPGFPVIFQGISRGGRAVNYDNQYDFRFLINVGNEIFSYNEAGKRVDGWMFQGMTGALKDDITYYVANGKDIISFSDINNKQYVLSRRGDYRKPGEVYLRTRNTSPFILGNLDNSSLRKLGYSNSYIYNYYLLDGSVDSVKLDEAVNPIKVFWEYNLGDPHLIIEENLRVVAFNEYGYQQTEVLKPTQNSKFVGRMGKQDSRYVFADNSQNNLYLLNAKGKLISPLPVKGTGIYAYQDGFLYTFVGTEMIIYKID